MRKISSLLILACALGCCAPGVSQTNPNLQTYFREYVKLTDEQVESIRSGKAFAKALPSRTGAEVFVFGAVYVKAAPEAYVKLSRDFDRLRNVSGFLAVNSLGSPPRLSDLDGFAFDSGDIESLKKCKPGDCDVQLPGRSIEELKQSVDWSSPKVAEQVNEKLRQAAIEKLVAYQRDGNRVLGVYSDKEQPVDVAEQFKYMLSYSKALPEYLPDFYGYLLSYPQGKPANTEDVLYWAKVKFGLKPTLRVIHVITMQGGGPNQGNYVFAEKQLYSSHYFQTALDLTFCISDRPDSQGRGFYLIKAMGSEQAGLTGVKGSIVRKAAVNKSVSSLQKSLAAIKDSLEHGQ